MITNVLLIDDSGGPNLLDTIRCLAYQQAVHIYVLAPEKKSYFNTIPFSRYVKKYEYLEHFDSIDLLGKINKKIAEWKIDVVLPAKQSNMLFFANANGEFDRSLLPPISDLQTIQTISDKWLLYRWLQENYFPTPKSNLLTKQGNSINYPVLLKPRLDTYEKRFELLENETQYQELLKEPDFKSENYILQEYLLGEDIDISFLADRGEIKAYTIQKGLVRENFSFATGIEFVENKELLKICCAMVQKLNWSGIAHLDFVYHQASNAYHLIDFNPRLWSTILGSLYAGVNFPALMVKMALGENITFSGFRKTQFYLAQQALHKPNLSKLKRSNWKYILSDPIPEMMKGMQKILPNKHR